MQESQVTVANAQHPAGAHRQSRSSRVSPRSGFTLTELLIVIAIIAVLAGLIAAAAVNALHKGRQTRVTLEIQQMSSAIENFKNDPNIGGVYPCSVAYSATPTNAQLAQARSDLQRTFSKMFQRANEPALPVIISKLIGDTSATGGTGTKNFGHYLEGGMSPNEALYFWLGGFSSDSQRPLSGPGGPSYLVSDGEVLEGRTPIFEFDLGRLGPRDASGKFSGRYIIYPDPVTGDDRRINLWTYVPAGSDQPYAYFDVSRLKPSTCTTKFGGALPLARANPLDASPTPTMLTPVREPLETATAATAANFASTRFANQGKFQLLHPGLDGVWDDNLGNGFSQLLYPEGPYIGAIADTLSNLGDGTFGDASEQ
jgi:prepilin-type N-terminal cleavage/methylation domain-containing protein